MSDTEESALNVATRAKPGKLEWLPVVLEGLILLALGYRLHNPMFLKGQLLPCLAAGLLPGTVIRLLGYSSWGAHRVGVAVGLILFMVYNGDIQLDALRAVFDHPGLLAGGIVLVCLTGLFGAARWAILLKGQSMHLGFGPTLRLVLVGMFFNLFVPGSTGGDLFRAYYVGRDQKRTSEALTTVILDRFLGLPPLVLILAGAGLLNLPLIRSNPAFSNFGTILGAVLGVSMVILIIVFLGASRLARWLEPLEEKIPGGRHLVRLSHATGAYRKTPGALALAMFFGLIAHLLLIFAACLFGHAAGLGEITLTQYAILIPVGMACNSLPISPGGAGVGEKAFAFLFDALQTGSGPQGLAVMVCLRMGLLPCALAGAALYALGKHAIDDAMTQARESQRQTE